MKIVNRREFLQKGSLGIAALTAACQMIEAQGLSRQQTRAQKVCKVKQ